MTINYDTDYDVQVVADGKHVEVWWGPAGGDMAKIIEVDSAAVVSGPRLSFLATANTVVRVDNINITTPDTDRTTYTYNNGNELLTMVKDSGTTTFTYDDWGRQVSKVIGANSAVYTYRFGSMLKEINSTIPGEADLVHYAYDAFYKRREVRVTEASVVTSDQWYRYDSEFNAIARYGDGDLTDWVVGTRNQTLSFDMTLPILAVIGSNAAVGAWGLPVSDHINSIRAIFDSTKKGIARIEYGPFGNFLSLHGNSPDSGYGFGSLKLDEGHSLLYSVFRYYCVETNRWTSRDPLGVIDGPNVYAYVGNNPISNTDYLGLAIEKVPDIMEDRKACEKELAELGELEFAIKYGDSGGACSSLAKAMANCNTQKTGVQIKDLVEDAIDLSKLKPKPRGPLGPIKRYAKVGCGDGMSTDENNTYSEMLLLLSLCFIFIMARRRWLNANNKA